MFFQFVRSAPIEAIKIKLPSLLNNQKIIKKLLTFYRGILKKDAMAKKLKALLDESKLLTKESAQQEISLVLHTEFAEDSVDDSYDRELDTVWAQEEIAVNQEKKFFAPSATAEVLAAPPVRTKEDWESLGIFVERKKRNIKAAQNVEDLRTNTTAAISASM